MRPDVSKPIGSFLSNYKGVLYSADGCPFSSNLKTLLHPVHLQAATPFFTTTSVWTSGEILSDQNSASLPLVYPGSGVRSPKAMQDSIFVYPDVIKIIVEFGIGLS